MSCFFLSGALNAAMNVWLICQVDLVDKINLANVVIEGFDWNSLMFTLHSRHLSIVRIFLNLHNISRR
jgi:hypothetical protein